MTLKVLYACTLLTVAGWFAPLSAQQAVFAYRLGRDTMAVEQYTRTPTSISGEVVSRSGAAVARLRYEATLANGRVTSVTYRSMNAAGQPVPNQPVSIRLTFNGDSVAREATFADSVSRRTLPARNGIAFAAPAYGLYEVAFAQMRRARADSMTFAIVGTGAGNPGSVTFVRGGGDTIRSRTNVVFRADSEGRMLAMDATATTQKLVATRGTGTVDFGALAATMRPAGALSGRGHANAAFLQSVVFINYGRPQVRERTVWGGELVPFDAVWRTGANEATHLATSRELAFGDVVVPPGLYTLWINNVRGAPQLVINRQVGQWGTVYDASRDLGRVPLQMSATPQHVEEFTITIRSLGGPRGAIELAWGDQMATAQFTAR